MLRGTVKNFLVWLKYRLNYIVKKMCIQDAFVRNLFKGPISFSVVRNMSFDVNLGFIWRTHSGLLTKRIGSYRIAYANKNPQNPNITRCNRGLTHSVPICHIKPLCHCGVVRYGAKTWFMCTNHGRPRRSLRGDADGTMVSQCRR